MTEQRAFDWGDLAFGSKKPLRSLHAQFIAAPREITEQRLAQLVKDFLPGSNIVLGISHEDYVLGFENQPQFKMLRQASVQSLLDKLWRAKLPNQVYVLNYSQKDLPFVIEKLGFNSVTLINGSWKHSFHTLPAFYELTKQRIIPQFVSPFVDETEAVAYATKTKKQIAKHLALPAPANEPYLEQDMVGLATASAKQSFDYAFQTGAAIGKKKGSKYTLLHTSYNEVVPYETFAMHNGATREQHLSPPNDLNHYDTVHAEVQGVINAQKRGIPLAGTTMFVNLLPCPVCSRVLVLSGIKEIIYQHDHSDGYAVKLLQQAGIAVRRLVI